MKRMCRIGGIAAVAAVVVACLLWLVKDRISGPPRIPLDEPSPFRPPEVAGEPTTSESDDLSDVKGIGPVYRSRLADAGIVRFAHLAAADPETVAREAGVSARVAEGWIAQASRLDRS